MANYTSQPGQGQPGLLQPGALDAITSATPSSSDTGSGSDAQVLVVLISSSDSGSGVDAGHINNPISSDSLTATESSSISVTLSNSDTGSGSDSGSVAETVAKASSDSVTGTDSVLSLYLVSDWSGYVTGITPGRDISQTLVMGPATIYVGNFGATEPLDSAVASAPSSADWSDLGGLLGGVQLTVKREYESIQLLQIPDKVMSRLKKEEFLAKAAIAEPSIDNFLFLLNEGTVATGAGFKSFTPSSTVDPATPLTYRAIIIDGWAPDIANTGGQKRRRIIMRKCLSIEGTTLEYLADKQTTQSVTWSAHRVDGVISPFKVIDQM